MIEIRLATWEDMGGVEHDSYEVLVQVVKPRLLATLRHSQASA